MPQAEQYISRVSPFKKVVTETLLQEETVTAPLKFREFRVRAVKSSPDGRRCPPEKPLEHLRNGQEEYYEYVVKTIKSKASLPA
ncbi:MAG TPA: hypothetical protein VGJ66_09465 [Pyrinomonadaceae bacterium]